MCLNTRTGSTQPSTSGFSVCHIPTEDKRALPGGFVRGDGTLDDAARRELEEEEGLKNVFLEQLHTFGEVGRVRVEDRGFLPNFVFAPEDTMFPLLPLIRIPEMKQMLDAENETSTAQRLGY